MQARTRDVQAACPGRRWVTVAGAGVSLLGAEHSPADLALAPLPFPWDLALLPLPAPRLFLSQCWEGWWICWAEIRASLGSSFWPVLVSCSIFNFSPARAEPRSVMCLTGQAAPATLPRSQGIRAVGGRGTWLFPLTPGSAAMGWALLLLWLPDRFLCPLSPFVSAPPLSLPSRSPWVGSTVLARNSQALNSVIRCCVCLIPPMGL